MDRFLTELVLRDLPLDPGTVEEVIGIWEKKRLALSLGEGWGGIKG